MNCYIPKVNKGEARLYIANELEESCAYLTIDQVKKRPDLEDFLPTLLILQEEDDNKDF
jgi:hypothetical protein